MGPSVCVRRFRRSGRRRWLILVNHHEAVTISSKHKHIRNQNSAMNFRTILFLLSTMAVDARLQAHRELIELPALSICHHIDDTHFQTESVNIFTGLFHIFAHSSDRFGTCQNACESLCESYSSYETGEDSCTCIEETADEPTACPEGLERSTTGDCVQKCTSMFGNPCGPGSACIDNDELGHTCSPLYDETVVCPVGCGPNSTCVGGSCECDAGYERPEPYLPCKKIV